MVTIMQRHERGPVILALGAVLLGLAWLFAAASSPPLYDGLGANSPYRYLIPQPGHPRTPPPFSARRVVPVSAGRLPLEVVKTAEQPHQAKIILQFNSLIIPPGVHSVVISVHAVAPPATIRHGSLDGNVYRFSVTGAGKELTRRSGRKISVELRGTGTSGSPAIEQYTGGHWVMRPTSVVPSTNEFIASVPSLGDFALVLPPAGKGGISPFIIIAVALVVLAVILVVLIRLARRPTGT